MNNFKNIVIVLLLGLVGFLGYQYFLKNKAAIKVPVVTETKSAPDAKNATYIIEKNKIKLVNGGATDGTFNSLSYYDANLGSIKTVAEVDGDKLPDVLVDLIYNSGGTGNFSYLGLVRGSGEPVEALWIGDRIIIQSIVYKSGLITINYLDHGEGEPMAAEPTTKKVFKAKFSNGKLIDLNGDGK